MSRQARWAAVLVAFLMFVAVFIWRTGVQADAATHEDCAKPSEFGQLAIAMPAKQAREILDGPGQRVPGHHAMRTYDPCGHPNAVDAELDVWYNKGRLVAAQWMVSWVTGPPPGYAPDGLVPCVPADPQALPYCDPNLPPSTTVCTDPAGATVECDFRRLP